MKNVTPMTVKEKKVYNKLHRMMTKYPSYLRYRKSRTISMEQNCGRFYQVDIYTNAVTGYNVNLENELKEWKEMFNNKKNENKNYK